MPWTDVWEAISWNTELDISACGQAGYRNCAIGGAVFKGRASFAVLKTPSPRKQARAIYSVFRPVHPNGCTSSSYH